ncbi:MAG: hypothetical protein CO135_02595 [Candidatus Levybacteria bacterium CG_4_9_14_3_um_filter_35_16]|nr:MAG: hypothetical protein COW87_02360 [Candidatus Levybacteria bacterium CG22_combo_CG10-13_8_21_14_all_35_11]PJA00530.1 MAG: hypothetical protein COX78_00410 [Candidatus Levybacteria bacterium CG_4_10_14_0_2_um_filter_35_8]PJA91151.1 MAG: hypothetical protein CO135_02595 [Candidatus Levybacteria bacterium CG_4_9_14_3_um_filter_35_16]PJC54029.1 MAG: hypothetical protein CO028_04425 [Candidatus Levybacteria bacterium CG_4_9_14_0_2_um_filter_35_21]
MKKISILFLSLVLFIVSPKVAGAETVLSIEGNGDSSQNAVNVSVQNATTVNQSNNADINNQVNSDANTGDNTANSNSGDTNISTGNITTTTDIQNQNINTNNFSNKDCGGCECSGPCESGEVIITGNGSDSNNNIDIGNRTSVNISQSNNVNIVNNVEVHANTGNNTADNNNGDVTIITGNITDKININNKNINQNSDPQGTNNGLFLYKISGNGEGSFNNIFASCTNELDYSVINIANILNNVVDDTNTGNNSADNNNGSVLITTGNIDSTINISNEDINNSDFSCFSCKKPVNPPPPPVTSPPPPPPPGGGGNGGGGGDGRSDGRSDGGSSGSNIAQAVLGAMLPATGGGYWLFLMILGALIMFFTGLFLRLHSGNSPGVTVA